jgi:hypothetical protein
MATKARDRENSQTKGRGPVHLAQVQRQADGHEEDRREQLHDGLHVALDLFGEALVPGHGGAEGQEEAPRQGQPGGKAAEQLRRAPTAWASQAKISTSDTISVATSPGISVTR